MAGNELVRSFKKLSGYKWDTYTLWSDFIEIMALTISNSVDKAQWDKREARYLEIAQKYSREELDIFAGLYADLIVELESNPRDVLGESFMELELGSKWKGQFFTPYPVADIMARSTCPKDEILRMIDDKGFVLATDSAIGGGVTMIALFNYMRDIGVNPQDYLVIEGGDIDSRACHMSYVQLSLLGANCVIRKRNGLEPLSVPDDEIWFSPFYILGAWAARRGLGGDMGRLMAGMMLNNEVGLSTTLETEGGQLGFDVSEVS